jgi:NAD(P)H-dependent flavin oxidoreductase YrpB (nitropropane dioxygenase family)
MGVGISLSGLASAVANEGGIGVIATAGIGIHDPGAVKEFLAVNIRAMRDEIRKARSMTKGILGVNIMVVLTDYAKMVAAAVEEKIDIIFSGAGLPLTLPSLIPPGSTTKLVPIVSSARAAALLIRKWIHSYKRAPDAIVVEGPKAGGHLGFSEEQLADPAYSLENLVPQVVAEVRAAEKEHGVKIPVIAGGGIYTGADIVKIMDLGADGVQLATRFVTTHECDADDAFKQAYIDAKQEDLEIIKSPVGLPGRAIRNRFIDEVREGLRKPFRCIYHCITTCKMNEAPYCIAMALSNARQGKLRNGFAFAGENAWRATHILSVKELMTSLVDEYEQARREKT